MLYNVFIFTCALRGWDKEVRAVNAGTAQQIFELGGGGGGLKKNAWTNFCLGGGRGILNFSKVTENAFIKIKLLIFSTSSVMFLSGLKIDHH